MKPIVDVEQMKAIDRSAPVPESVLVEHAGWHVARVAKQIMGGTYGRHVVVVAGPGNNGADGRVAARLLRERGAGVRVVSPGELGVVPRCDLVIDAAFGTGFHGEYEAPNVSGSPVLAVDIPSGVNGNTGVASDGAVRAVKTVTFAAYKPGHFLADGAERCGEIELCDIGLNVFGVRIHLVETADVISALPQRGHETNKWKAAVAVVAGSPGMLGAARLASSAAARAGAGMVRLAIPGVDKSDLPAGEAVAVALPSKGWDANVLEILERVHALVIGPGLGRDPETVACVRRVVAQAQVPTVIDADGLFALGSGGELEILNARKAATVLTPHDGEFAHLAGDAPGADRVASVNALAQRTDAIVLAKGSTTIVSGPDGDVFFTNTGGPRLATAGTGDVLSGVIGAFLARGLTPAMAAACGAHIHGLAAQRGFKQGLVAGDLPENVAKVLSDE